MVRTEQLAEAARSGDALGLRSLMQDLVAENPCIAECLPPASNDPAVLAIAAGIIEMLAERRQEHPPTWTRAIGAANSPIYLLKSAETMPRLRLLCQNESPLPLRRRNIFTTPTFLEFA